jgi:hypothetical protein
MAVTNANLSSQELWNMVHASQIYSQLNALFEKVFSSPANSAAVERVFSSSELLMRPKRVRITTKLLWELACLSESPVV